MTPVEILKAARALIDTPEKWTKGTFARDADGHRVHEFLSPRATCFCAVGALRHVTRDYWPDAERLLAQASGKREGVSLYDFNDFAEHGQVLAAFDRAIALAETK